VDPIPWDVIRKYMKDSTTVLYQLLNKVREKLSVKDCPSIEVETFRWVPTYALTLPLSSRCALFQIISHMMHERKSLLKDYIEPFDCQLRKRAFYKVEYKKEEDVFSFVNSRAEKDTGRVDYWFMIPIHSERKESFSSLTKN